MVPNRDREDHNGGNRDRHTENRREDRRTTHAATDHANIGIRRVMAMMHDGGNRFHLAPLFIDVGHLFAFIKSANWRNRPLAS